MIYRIPGGSWNYIDVTAAANAPAVGPAGYEINTKLSAYSWSVDRTDHIVYKGADNHIHELWQQYGTWRHADLTISSGATVTAAANTQPYGLQSEIDQGQHIIYQGSDNHIHELVFKAGSWWTDIDLIAASGNSTIETGYTGGIGACSTPMYDHIWIMYSDYKRNYDIDMLMHNLKPPERMWWNDETANPSSSLSYMPPGNTYTNNPTLFYSGSYDVYNPEHFLYVCR